MRRPRGRREAFVKALRAGAMNAGRPPGERTARRLTAGRRRGIVAGMDTDLDGVQPDVDENLREFIDRLVAQGYTVADGDSPDPVLIDPMG
ncbi:MAG: hypothetical protein KDB60_15135, partial [Propionibacteriaceae bacterium]|nr:hypothetical protein [Propionibacteriaceae bacterium]